MRESGARTKAAVAWRAIPGPLSKRKRRLDSLEAAQGAPRDLRRDSRGEQSPWLPIEYVCVYLEKSFQVCPGVGSSSPPDAKSQNQQGLPWLRQGARVLAESGREAVAGETHGQGGVMPSAPETQRGERRSQRSGEPRAG